MATLPQMTVFLVCPPVSRTGRVGLGSDLQVSGQRFCQDLAELRQRM